MADLLVLTGGVRDRRGKREWMGTGSSRRVTAIAAVTVGALAALSLIASTLVADVATDVLVSLATLALGCLAIAAVLLI